MYPSHGDCEQPDIHLFRIHLLITRRFHLITWTFFVPETHAPTLLRRKAAKLQKQADQTGTGEHFIGKYDKTKESAIGIIKVGLARPFKMLFREVIVWTISLYSTSSDCSNSERADLRSGDPLRDVSRVQ